MIKKKFVMKQDYDVQNDSLFLYVADDYNYKESIEMDENTILDFDENYVPVALEILKALEFFNVNKFSLTRPIGLDMIIEIDEKSITMKASFLIQIRQRTTEKPINIKTPNDISLPLQETHFAMAEA